MCELNNTWMYYPLSRPEDYLRGPYLNHNAVGVFPSDLFYTFCEQHWQIGWCQCFAWVDILICWKFEDGMIIVIVCCPSALINIRRNTRWWKFHWVARWGTRDEGCENNVLVSPPPLSAKWIQLQQVGFECPHHLWVSPPLNLHS